MRDKRIVIIDDETDMTRLLTIELQTEGADIAVAHNGIAGLDLIKQMAPDLVLLDVMMPQMDGYEVLRRMKEDPETRDTLVVLLTAKGQEHDMQKGLTLGADDYITKPFHPGLLIKRLQRALKKQKAVDWPKVRILIIEDNEGERRTFVSWLKKLECQIYEAPDGEQGLEAAIKFKPDLIICDVILPGMDGFAVLESLKKTEIREVPVIFFTVKSSEEEIQKAVDMGVEDYLVKPALMDLFIRRIRMILTKEP